jgi:thymidylate synthase (FAD)
MNKPEVIFTEQRFEVMTPRSIYNDYPFELEEIARVCYKSEDKIKDDYFSTKKFMKRIIESGHESILEHKSITVKFICDRAIANALVRHRHCAFSQESTHYINYLNRGYTVIVQEGLQDVAAWMSGVTKIIHEHNQLDEKNFVSRSLFPLCFKTELVMTTNIREWRHILRIRTADNCHIQMRTLMRPLLKKFKEELPILFFDL